MLNSIGIVALNGPPRCGKDTVSAGIRKLCASAGMICLELKLASPLRDALNEAHPPAVGEKYYEKYKDTPNFIHSWDRYMADAEACECQVLYHGKPNSSLRQFMVDYWESSAAEMGNPWLVDNMALRIASLLRDNDIGMSKRSCIVISDCGRLTEYTRLTDHYGVANVRVVELVREGANWGDSNDNRESIRTKVPAAYGRLVSNAEMPKSRIATICDASRTVFDTVVRPLYARLG